MKTMIIIFLLCSIFLIADEVSLGVVVTFKDVSLEEAVELEELFKYQFQDYDYKFEVVTFRIIQTFDFQELPKIGDDW